MEGDGDPAGADNPGRLNGVQGAHGRLEPDGRGETPERGRRAPRARRGRLPPAPWAAPDRQRFGRDDRRVGGQDSPTVHRIRVADVSEPTVYRRFEDIQVCDLLREETALDPAGHHAEYRTELERIIVELDEEGVGLELARREAMADRFTRRIEGM